MKKFDWHAEGNCVIDHGGSLVVETDDEEIARLIAAAPEMRTALEAVDE